MIYLIPFIAFVLFIIDYKMTTYNMNVDWNGFGCIEKVIRGESMQPMQYRVFIPWLTTLLGGEVLAYLFIKYLGLLFSLFSFYWFLGVLEVNQAVGMLLLAALIPITMMFDYADGYWELGFFALGFGLIYSGGALWLLMVVIFLATLNRETAIFIALSYVAFAINQSSLDITGSILILGTFGVSFLIPRYIYGKKARYCPFNLIKRNLAMIKEERGVLSGHFHSFLLLSSVIAFCVIKYNSIHNFQPFIWTMLLFIPVIMIPGIWQETRIFIPLATVVIPLGVI